MLPPSPRPVRVASLSLRPAGPPAAAPASRRNVRRGRVRSSTATSSCGGRDRPRLAAVLRRDPSVADGEREHLGQRQPGAPAPRPASAAEPFRLPAHDDVAVLVGDRAVVREPVDLVARRRAADLGDDDLDLERLGLRGEHRAERLRVRVGQAAGGDVLAVVGVAAQVGVAHAGHAQVLELVVLADGREADPVVDLGDLVQRARRVLGGERDPVVVLQDHDGPTAGDALARVVGPVLHQLLGRDVERHAHRAPPRARWARSTLLARPARRPRASSVVARPAGSPASVTVATTGQIPRVAVRAAGRRVVVGRVDERLDGDPHGAVGVEAGPPQLLQRAAREHRARADRVVVVLLVAAARDVVGEDPPGRAGPGRSRRTAAPRPAPASPGRGCRGSSSRAGWPCRRARAGVPSIFS